jgi:glucose-6-phosphate dehydrogenase assembly protein OpcA
MARSDAVWSEQGTAPDAIEAALRQLLIERHAENEGFLPARVLNMIVFVDRAWSGEIANRLRGVGRYHASRLLVLSFEPGRTRMDAQVSIVSEGDPTAGEVALLRETVVVEIGDRHLDDLLTIADPLVVSDLPTLLWSPHGHHLVVEELLALAQAVLVDSVDEPDAHEGIDRACALSGQAYVVDLAWLRSTPWRERVAASFDPPALRPELRAIESLTVRHHPDSTVAAMLFVGWLASRLGWQTHPLTLDGDAHAGSASAGQHSEVALRLEAAPELQVRGLEGLTLKAASGHELRLDRGPGGLHARDRNARGEEREWTILGASRGEAGILGEGIRQALLRDPTYVAALRAAQGLFPPASTTPSPQGT